MGWILGDEQQEDNAQVYILLTLLFLSFYALVSSFLEHKQLPIHRSAVAIIIGIIVGLILNLTASSAYKELNNLNQIIVFNILLPPILFAQGYTLRKGAFLKNIKYICIFGIVGTFVSFFITTYLIYQANNFGTSQIHYFCIDLVIDINDIHNFRTLSNWQILLLSACLCSIDTMASEQSVEDRKYPRLHSIIFGEDIIKDTITIVLFRSILNLEQRESPTKLIIYWYTFFQMLGNFVLLIVGSIAFGICSSFLMTFLVKKCRFVVKDQGITETSLLFLFGFFNYILTQTCDFSGAISILVYGIVLNHYNNYNMTQKSIESSKNTFEFIANISQGLLFLIMGITIWQGQWLSPDSDDDKMTHSYIFFGIVMAVLAFGRVINVYVMYLLSKIFIKNNKIKIEELHMLFFSGMVRGATPFALFTSVSFTNDNKYIKNEGVVLKSTIILVVIFSSVILNSLIPTIFKRLLKRIAKQSKQELIQYEQQHELKISKENQLYDEEGEELNEEKKVSKLKVFQEKYLKELLIHNYKQRCQDIKREKIDNKRNSLREAIEAFNEENVDLQTENTEDFNQHARDEDEDISENKRHLIN